MTGAVCILTLNYVSMKNVFCTSFYVGILIAMSNMVTIFTEVHNLLTKKGSLSCLCLCQYFGKVSCGFASQLGEDFVINFSALGFDDGSQISDLRLF